MSAPLFKSKHPRLNANTRYKCGRRKRECPQIRSPRARIASLRQSDTDKSPVGQSLDGDIDLSQRANHAAELWKIVKSMLEKAEEAEKELGSPNKVTTGIACKVLEQLGEHFPELREPWEMVKSSIYDALYSSRPESMNRLSLQEIHSLETFFGSVRRLTSHHDFLAGEIAKWENSDAIIEKEQEKQEAVMKRIGSRWQHYLLGATFNAWRKNACEQRARRQMLSKFVNKISKGKLRDIFLGWRHFAQNRARRRAKEHLKELNKKCAAFQAEKERLAEELDSKSSKRTHLEEEIAMKKERATALEVINKQLGAEVDGRQKRNSLHQEVCQGWEQFTVKHVPQELKNMRLKLEQMQTHQHVNFDLLFPNNSRQTTALVSMPVESVVLAWANQQIEKWNSFVLLEGRGLYKRIKDIENYGQSLSVDTSCFLGVLAALGSTRAKESLKVSDIRPLRDEADYQMLCSALYEQGLPKHIATPIALRECRQDINFSILGFLFLRHPMWRQTLLPKLQAAKDTVAAAAKSWEQVERASKFVDSSVMDHALKDFEARVDEARRRMQQAVIEDKQMARAWQEMKYKVKISAWYVLLQRHRSQPFADFVDNKARRVSAELASMQPNSLPDVRSHSALVELFRIHSVRLGNLFEFYCGLPDERSTHATSWQDQEQRDMSVEQFVRLLKDAKIISLDLITADIARALCARFCQPGECINLKTFALILVAASDLVVGYGNWFAKVETLLKTKIFANAPAEELRDFRVQLCASNWKIHFEQVRRRLFKGEREFVEVSTVRKRLICANFIQRHSGRRMADNCITEGELDVLVKSLSLNTSGYLSCEECTELLFAAFLACYPDENLLSSSQLSAFMRLVCDEA